MAKRMVLWKAPHLYPTNWDYPGHPQIPDISCATTVTIEYTTIKFLWITSLNRRTGRCLNFQWPSSFCKYLLLPSQHHEMTHSSLYMFFVWKLGVQNSLFGGQWVNILVHKKNTAEFILERWPESYVLFLGGVPIWKTCSSHWESSPSRGENKKCWKPPPRLMYGRKTAIILLMESILHPDNWICLTEVLISHHDHLHVEVRIETSPPGRTNQMQDIRFRPWKIPIFYLVNIIKMVHFLWLCSLTGVNPLGN